MTHLTPGGPRSAAPAVLLSNTGHGASFADAPSGGIDQGRLGDAIAVRRRALAHLEMTLVAECERAAVCHAARGVRIDDRATWDKATWQRYLAAASRFEPDYVPAMRRLLREIDQLTCAGELPAPTRRAA